MAFLVEGERKYKGELKVDRLDLEILCVGKRCGLSFAEINELRFVDLIYFIDVYTGAKDGGTRPPTQEEINKFFSQ
jgi:hypothetical protein